MDKLFTAEFELNAKMLTVVYICYKYKFPLAFFLSFYEMYGDTSMFALKALSCSKKIKLTDNTLVKIIEESRLLYSQIVRGVSVIRTIKQLSKYNPDNEEIPNYPSLNLDVFTDEYKEFIQDYLLPNIDDVYAPYVKLQMSSDDIYRELVGAGSEK